MRDGIIAAIDQEICLVDEKVVCSVIVTGEMEVKADHREITLLANSQSVPKFFANMIQPNATIRVLREDPLSSRFSPMHGIRYEGLYVSTRSDLFNKVGTNS